MKKVLVILLALVFLTGCVGAGGWAKRDKSPIDPIQLEKDRSECNRGLAVCMAVDILLTGGDCVTDSLL
jgi:hypothetical protein